MVKTYHDRLYATGGYTEHKVEDFFKQEEEKYDKAYNKYVAPMRNEDEYIIGRAFEVTMFKYCGGTRKMVLSAVADYFNVMQYELIGHLKLFGEKHGYNVKSDGSSYWFEEC